MDKIICEDLMKITPIFVLRISLKIAKLRYRRYYNFGILGDVALKYHPTKFVSNCKTQCGYMDKTVKKYIC